MHRKIEEARQEEGFTLIELLVVVIIIGILAAIAIPVFLNQRRAAWQSELTSTMRNVALEVETSATLAGGNYENIFTDASDDTEIQAYLDDLLATVVQAGDAPVSIETFDFQPTSFWICGEHESLVDGEDAADVHVVYDSGAGGIQEPADGSCTADSGGEEVAG